jgi:CubicO group peptidase (beta-lactamase class C family)
VKFLLLIFFAANVALSETRDVSSALNALREKHQVPALAAAAMHDGELVALGVSGMRQFGQGDPVTTNDLWHIGSCTKSMTATLAGILVDEGKARWDMKIADVLPELKGKLDASWREVTLEQLLVQRSGAPGNAPPDLWQTAGKRQGTELQQRLAFVTGLIARPTEVPAGTKFVYSNQGYTIAGAMLERLAKKPYAELLREKVFIPLGMKSGGFGGPGPNQPRGHDGKPGAFTPMAADFDNPPAITPAGRVHCTLADYARYASWHARGPLQDVKLMSDATFQKLHTAPPGGSYAMGWIVTERPWAGGTALWHNGSNTKWYCVMWIAPQKGDAYVAMTNCPPETGGKACDEAIGTVMFPR